MGLQSKDITGLPVERLNPASLPNAGNVGYSQISIAEASRLAFVSGQVAWSADGKPVPETLAGQVEVVFGNLQAALDELSAGKADIIQLRAYVVGLSPERMEVVMPALLEFLEGVQPSITGVGVASLAAPDLLVEVEMVVQVPK